MYCSLIHGRVRVFVCVLPLRRNGCSWVWKRVQSVALELSQTPLSFNMPFPAWISLSHVTGLDAHTSFFSPSSVSHVSPFSSPPHSPPRDAAPTRPPSTPPSPSVLPPSLIHCPSATFSPTFFSDIQLTASLHVPTHFRVGSVLCCCGGRKAGGVITGVNL